MDKALSVNMPTPDLEFKLLTPRDDSPEWNESLEVVFVLQGFGWLQIEGGGTDYALQQSDIFVVNSLQICSVALEENALAIALFVSPDFVAAMSPDISSPVFNCKSFLYGEDRQQSFDALRRDFAQAFRAQYKNESPLSVHLHSRGAALIDTLFRHFLEPEHARREASGPERLRAAVDYIYRNYRENITLKDIAAQSYLSESYLSRSFRKYFGISFIGYLTRVRLLRAEVLLRGDDTITGIAYECGFSNANAMIEAFKRYHGTTPGQYRKQIRQVQNTCAVQEGRGAEGFSTAFASLMRYLEDGRPLSDISLMDEATEVCADLDIVSRPADLSWKRLVNSGYARDLLDGALQEQLG